MAAETLFEATNRLLKNCPRHITFADIAAGSGLTASWISMFSRGQIPDPGVHKIQQLFDYMSIKRPPVGGKFELSVLKSALPKGFISTVYIVYAGSTVVYVGSTYAPRTRILGHEKFGLFIAHKATHIELIYFPKDKEKEHAKILEKDLIRQYSPAINCMKRETLTRHTN